MISVVIPAYNCARTIRMTLDSVLRQTLAPDQILVVDDGSTDGTPSILRSYQPQITVLTQKNAGTAVARNVLCHEAVGDLIAFLDSDDLWHPEYIETQNQLFHDYPDAVALFTGHYDFTGFADFAWSEKDSHTHSEIEIIKSMDFIRRYNAASGPFNMSFCCVPKSVISELGEQPFRPGVAEDCYFHNSVASLGPILYMPRKLAAYRIIEGSVSSNRVKWAGAVVEALEALVIQLRDSQKLDIHKVMETALHSAKRSYAKMLLGQGRVSEARQQLSASVMGLHRSSLSKSIALLLLSYLPSAFQPHWPGNRGNVAARS